MMSIEDQKSYISRYIFSDMHTIEYKISIGSYVIHYLKIMSLHNTTKAKNPTHDCLVLKVEIKMKENPLIS